MQSTQFFADKNILIAPELAFTMGCIVGNSGVIAGPDGKKIIKAGTPVGNAANVFEKRDTVLTVTNTATQANSKGVVLHDVDVTAGNANATLVVSGYVDLLKLDKGLTVSEEAKTALTRIVFMKGAK